MNAWKIVDMLLNEAYTGQAHKMVLPSRLSDKAIAKLPFWKRDAINAHKNRMAQIRGRYGRSSDKAQPTPRQAKLIARWKQQGKERRIIDYCDREKIDPNRVLDRLSTAPAPSA